MLMSERRDNLNKQSFREAACVYHLRDVFWDSGRNIGASHGAAAAEEVVELEVEPARWMERDLELPAGQWLSATPLRKEKEKGFGWWIAVLRLDLAEPPEDSPVPLPVAPRNHIGWREFRNAVSGDLSHWNRVTDRLVLLIPLRDRPDEHVPAVIHGVELDDSGWKTRVLLHADLVEDAERWAKHFGPPRFGW